MPPPTVIDRTGGKSAPRHLDQNHHRRPQHEWDGFSLSLRPDRFSRRHSPPLIQWKPAPGPIDVLYIHVSSKRFDYKEIFTALPNAQLDLPRDAWDAAATESQGAPDPTFVEVTTMSNGVVTGPIKESWVFARGLLKSAIYYNTYNSAKTLPNNGAVMRILRLPKSRRSSKRWRAA